MVGAFADPSKVLSPKCRGCKIRFNCVALGKLLNISERHFSHLSKDYCE